MNTFGCVKMRQNASKCVKMRLNDGSIARSVARSHCSCLPYLEIQSRGTRLNRWQPCNTLLRGTRLSPVQEGCISSDVASLGIRPSARTFALKVRGESMVNPHICDGDTVILEFHEPRKGDIVAALIDGETTLKRYVMKNTPPPVRPTAVSGASR